ncbi:MAG: ATP synthase F1 subunit epsilon [Patescibacteria group bacterium]|nr:ATP synthase F1 subunit epsilon [Patescibacteria group bacterium]
MNLHLEIITPEKVVYRDDVNEISAETVNGQITILPNHVGLVTQITPGELIVKKNNKNYYLAVMGGFLEIVKNNVTILSDYAIRSEDIEANKVLEAQKRAEKLAKEASEKASEKDFALAETQLRRAILELKVAKKRK